MMQNLVRNIAKLAKRRVLVVITARMRGRGRGRGDFMYYIRRAASAALPLDAAHRSVKREHSVGATVQELTALKTLKDEQVLDAGEYERLKQKLLEECLRVPL